MTSEDYVNEVKEYGCTVVENIAHERLHIMRVGDGAVTLKSKSAEIDLTVPFHPSELKELIVNFLRGEYDELEHFAHEMNNPPF